MFLLMHLYAINWSPHILSSIVIYAYILSLFPDSKVHGANMGPSGADKRNNDPRSMIFDKAGSYIFSTIILIMETRQSRSCLNVLRVVIILVKRRLFDSN